MKQVLSGFQPQNVFSYFEELSRIPRSSGSTTAASDFCEAFAKTMGLSYRREACGNVILWKPASAGYEESPAVILQGHLDMVAEKEPSSLHDFLTDPLELFVEGDWIGARGTTLGADDGIAVAYMLALLAENSLPHPPLICVFTVEEETGMDGAYALDVSGLNAAYLINMDSEDEGTLLSSCAGGIRVHFELPVQRTIQSGILYELTLSGLLGGHSGTEIDKERGNAVLLMGRVLHELSRQLPFSLRSLAGGQKDNVIPNHCAAEIVVSPDREALLQSLIEHLHAELSSEYQASDPGLQLFSTKKEGGSFPCLMAEDQLRLLSLLLLCPSCVQAMSRQIAGLVETSVNLGTLQLNKNQLCAHFSIRSSVESRKHSLCHRFEFIAKQLGASLQLSGDYPGWSYRAHSHLREEFCAAYHELTGKAMKVEAIHAGLECGIFASRLPQLDIVSLGPDMQSIHSTAERLSISSTRRTWELLCEVLR